MADTGVMAHVLSHRHRGCRNFATEGPAGDKSCKLVLGFTFTRRQTELHQVGMKLATRTNIADHLTRGRAWLKEECFTQGQLCNVR